jgi:mycofactocin precursor
MENEATLTDASSGVSSDTDAGTDTRTDSAELVDELLIEEISIDGMCGVY